MPICHDRKVKKSWLPQQKYTKHVLDRFNKKNAKPVSMPVANHFKYSRNTCPSTQEEKEDVAIISYSSIVSSLMYAMVCTQPNIAHVVSLDI